MKQIAQSQRGGKLRVVDVPLPALRPEGLLVRTQYSLISAGTERAKVDLAKKSLVGKAMARPDQVRQVIAAARQAGLAATYQKVMNRLDALNPLGYSSAGVVVAVGDAVRGFAAGDRVACAGAGYANHAEYAYVPRNLCARVPDGVGLDDASFATVGAIALQGIRQSGAVLGETVGVIGLGLLGLLTVQMLRAAGCRVAGIDIDPKRCALASAMGADVAVDPGSAASAVRALAPHGLDAVILTAATSSSDPIKLAAELARDRARLIVVGAVGTDIPRSPFYEKELEIRLSRSYGPGRYDADYEERGHDYPIGYVRWTEGRNLDAFLDLLAQKKIDLAPLITHRFRIDRAEAAYDVIEGKSGEPFLGVVLEYEEGEAAAPMRTAVTLRPPVAADGKIGVAFVGAGNFAQSMLLPPLKARSDVRLRSVVTASGLSARSAAERFAFEECGSDSQQLLADPAVSLVVIASRHDTHAATAAAALRAGKAVFVEKPLAIDEAQLRDVEEAHAAGGFLMVGFNRRFAPLVARLRDFARSMNEPKIMSYRVNAGFVPREHWAHEHGGRIIGEVCHFVDLMLDLAASPIVEVSAAATPDNGRYSRDNLVATIRFADGSVGSVLYCAAGSPAMEKERLEIFGGGKSAVLDDFKKLTLFDGRKSEVIRGAADKGHRHEMNAVVDALRRGGPSPIPFEDIAAVTRATFAIVESLTS